MRLDPVYIFAAGNGHRTAQAELAASCCSRAEAIAAENPALADEYFTAAELFAGLACAHGRSQDIAVLAGIFAMRCLHSASRDPVRSLQYREEVERLFDKVEDASDSQALGTIAYALNKLADADPEDDRASDRLNRVIAAMPADDAHLLRTVVRPAECKTQKEQH